MDLGRGSSLRHLRFVCVFALVFASNVTVVKVCPLLVQWSLKTEVSRIVIILRAKEPDEPDNFSPFLMVWTNFEEAIAIRAHPGLISLCKSQIYDGPNSTSSKL